MIISNSHFELRRIPLVIQIYLINTRGKILSEITEVREGSQNLRIKSNKDFLITMYK